MENKIELFHSGLTTVELMKKLQRKKNTFAKIAFYVLGGILIVISFAIMFYSKLAGFTILFCLFMMASLVVCNSYACYAILEKYNYAWFGDSEIHIRRSSRTALYICNKAKIRYTDFQRYYVGMCNESFIPTIKGLSIMSAEQCRNIYGEYINLIGSGMEVLAVIPYTKDREEFLKRKCQMKKMTEDEYWTMLRLFQSDTPQEKEIMNQYRNYIN